MFVSFVITITNDTNIYLLIVCFYVARVLYCGFEIFLLFRFYFNMYLIITIIIIIIFYCNFVIFLYTRLLANKCADI